MRRLALGALLTLCACSSGNGGRSGYLRYLEDREARRQALLDALWFRDNDYARLRLQRFATGAADDWERQPPFLPEVAPLRGRPAAAETWQRLDAAVPAAEEEVAAALGRLGAAAFFGYPAQLVDGFELALGPEGAQRAYGLWYGYAPGDNQGLPPRVSGLLRVRLPAGGQAVALSCSTCHAGPDDAAAGAVVPGRPNGRLDIGLLAQDQAPAGTVLPAGAWGAGRLDVSPDGIDNPARIPDLRVVSRQAYLHHDATLRQKDVFSLAVRIETLLLTNLRGVAPPPAVALGLAVYLRALPPPRPAPADPRGAEVFAAHCAGCHAAPDYGGGPVALAIIGTDSAVGRSPERGTGGYRVPSLVGVASRGPLLHDGRVPDLGSLLDPSRLAPGYSGGLHGPGAVPGHAYGLELGAAERAALLAFLASL